MIQVRFALTCWDQPNEGLGPSGTPVCSCNIKVIHNPYDSRSQRNQGHKIQFRVTVFSETYSRKMLNQSFGKLCLWVNLLIKYLGEKYLFPEAYRHYHT